MKGRNNKKYMDQDQEQLQENIEENTDCAICKNGALLICTSECVEYAATGHSHICTCGRSVDIGIINAPIEPAIIEPEPEVVDDQNNGD